MRLNSHGGLASAGQGSPVAIGQSGNTASTGQLQLVGGSPCFRPTPQQHGGESAMARGLARSRRRCPGLETMPPAQKKLPAAGRRATLTGSMPMLPVRQAGFIARNVAEQVAGEQHIECFGARHQLHSRRYPTLEVAELTDWNSSAICSDRSTPELADIEHVGLCQHCRACRRRFARQTGKPPWRPVDFEIAV